MKKGYIFYVLFLAISGKSLAQKEKNFAGDEIYATINSIKDFDFGLAYKAGLSNNWYLRFDLLNAHFSKKETEDNAVFKEDDPQIDQSIQKKQNYGLGIGIEKKNLYNSKIEFLYGLSLIGYYDYQSTRGINPDSTMISTKILNEGWKYGGALNLGVLIKVAENLFVSGELSPQFLFQKESTQYIIEPAGISRTQSSSGYGMDFDFKDFKISLVYRFRR